MQTRCRWMLSMFVAVVAAAELACKSTECGEGTVERDGACMPADEVVDDATCGEFTVLQGGVCVPMFPPTECDPATTAEDVDPETGVTTCIGTGGGGCAAPLACPAPTAGKQTYCGRLYDVQTTEALEASGATGTACGLPPAADGPCALGIAAYDAIEFASNPMTAMPKTVGATYIDDCGRFRLTDIDPAASGFIGLGIDDALPANRGPGGITNAVGIASPQSQTGASVRDLEGFIARPATTAMWAASGGPSIAMGYYVMVFRAGRTGFAPQSGVVAIKSGMPIPGNDFYFAAAEVTRTTVDPARNATGANGTALVTNASVADTYYTGSGGLPAGCIFAPTKGATLPGVVFISIFRPTDAPGMTCPL